MALVHRQRIRLWRACHALLDQLEACATSLRRGEPELARVLPLSGVALVDRLRDDDAAGAERLLDRIDADLRLAVRRRGFLPALLAATRAADAVRMRVWVPEERDGPPTINREPPDFETRAAPLEVP